MSNTTKDQLDINLTVKSDTKDLDETKKKLDATKQKAREMAKATKESRQAVSAISAASAAASGNISAAATSMASLGGAATKLAGPIAIATTAIAAAYKALNDYLTTLDKTQAAIQNITTDNAVSQLNNLLKSYQDLQDTLTTLNDSRQLANQLADEELAANRKLEDANFALERDRALGALDPNDGTGRARVEAQFDRRRAQIDATRATTDTETQRDRHLTDAATAEGTAAADRATRDQLTAAAAQASLRLSATQQRQAQAAASPWQRFRYGGQQQAMERFQPQINTEKQTLEKMLAQIEQLNKSITKNDQQASASRTRANIIDTTAAPTTEATRQLQAQQANRATAQANATDAKREQEQRDIANQIAAKEAEAAAARHTVGQAQSQVATGQQAISTAHSVSELRAANAAYANQIADLTQIIKEGLDTAKRAEAEVARLRNRQSTSATGAVNLD